MGRAAAAIFAATLAFGSATSASAQKAETSPSATISAAPPAPPAPPLSVAAGGSPRSASLSWVRLDGASACANAPVIAEGIGNVLRRDALVPPSRAVMAIEARVERIPGRKRFRVTIDISSGDGVVKGTRRLESPDEDCRKLDEPAALAIALMIDPEAALRPAPPPPGPQLTIALRRDILVVPVPVLVQVPGPPPPLPPRRDDRESPELTLSIGPSLAFGLLPGPAAGLRFGVELGPPASLEFGDRVAIGPSSIRLGFGAYSGALAVGGADGGDGGGGGSASLSMVALLPNLTLCPTTLWIGARAALGACLAIDAGALSWTGNGFDTSVAEGVRPFVDVGPVAHARLMLAGPLALEIRGAAVAPLVRDRFVYGRAAGTSALAYEPGAIGAMLDVALAVGLGL